MKNPELAETQQMHPTHESQRFLPRAEWQRTVGAVLMRELVGDVFANDPTLEARDGPDIRYRVRDIGAPPARVRGFWKYVYAATEHCVQKASLEAENNNIILSKVSDRTSPLYPSLQEFTFNVELESTLDEGMRSMAHFPLNLIRSICRTAPEKDVIDSRYSPKSFTDVAKLLESEDIRSMIDESLLSVNGFWVGFSTGYSDLAPTPLGAVYPRYVFTDGQVRFSQKARDALHKPLRRNNRNMLQQGYHRTEPSAIAQQSSSGCPARFTSLRLSESPYIDELEYIASITGKSLELLEAKTDLSIVQQGVRFISKALRNANDMLMVDVVQEENRAREGAKRIGVLDVEAVVATVYEP